MKEKLKDFEIEVLREQEETLFEHDELNRKIFKNDFEKYFEARLDLDLYCKIMDDYTQKKMEEVKKRRQKEVWEENFEENSLEFEMPLENFGQMLTKIDPKNSDLYETGFTWAKALMRWLEIQYKNPQKQKRDSYRALTNCTLVTGKLAFAGFMPRKELEESFEPLDSEISKDGLEMALIFLERTLGSLNNLLGNSQFDKRRLSSFITLGNQLKTGIQEILQSFEV